MNEQHNFYANSFLIILLMYALFLIAGCSEENDSLAPYEGSPQMSDIVMESGSYTPKFTWLGGYVSAFGVNDGEYAALDSSILWLVGTDGDNLSYPIEYGITPQGAVDLTSNFGGQTPQFLVEDHVYTVWALKADVWNAIQNQMGKILHASDSTDNNSYVTLDDSLFISTQFHVQKTEPVDLWVNLDTTSVLQLGRLARVKISPTDTSNSLSLSWTIIQPDMPDSNLAAIGIVEGNQYDVKKAVWEVWSVDSSSGENVYGKNDVIEKPLILGQELPGTRTFVQFPETGLERNKLYYLWLANKEWDGEGRLRFASGYCYITFTTY